MYTEFFGLNEKPFSITPDPRYLYLTDRHAEALAHLVYGIKESGGFIQLTGEVGTGKTTLIRSLLVELPEKVEIAVILNPQLSVVEFLQAICSELKVELSSLPSKSVMLEALNGFLLRMHATGTRVVLIVDEAQTLDVELLEQVRLLTNLETAKDKLLQIILIGQPELRDLLARPDMRQVAQRITGRYHLEPLRREETGAYVKHRMRVAGAHANAFKPSAIRELYRQSKGIPRLINVVADRALLAAYALGTEKIDGRLVRRAAAEVFGKPRRRWLPYAASAGLLVAIAAMSTALGPFDTGSERSAQNVSSRAPTLALERRAEPVPDGARAVVSPPPTVEVEAAAERLESLDAVLSRAETVPDAAFRGLFSAWGITEFASDRAACLQAPEHGLRCLTLTDGSIRQLRALARPTVLSLVDKDGTTHPMLLIGVGYDRVKLVAGGEPIKVSLADVAQHWRGEHTMLWRPQTDEVSLRPGMSGAGVLWLREALARLESDHPKGREDADSVGLPDYYDAALEERVRRYQQARWLAVDGVAGAQTQIAIASDLAIPGVPVLGWSE